MCGNNEYILHTFDEKINFEAEYLDFFEEDENKGKEYGDEGYFDKKSGYVYSTVADYDTPLKVVVGNNEIEACFD